MLTPYLNELNFLLKENHFPATEFELNNRLEVYSAFIVEGAAKVILENHSESSSTVIGFFGKGEFLSKKIYSLDTKSLGYKIKFVPLCKIKLHFFDNPIDRVHSHSSDSIQNSIIHYHQRVITDMVLILDIVQKKNIESQLLAFLPILSRRLCKKLSDDLYMCPSYLTVSTIAKLLNVSRESVSKCLNREPLNRMFIKNETERFIDLSRR